MKKIFLGLTVALSALVSFNAQAGEGSAAPQQWISAYEKQYGPLNKSKLLDFVNAEIQRQKAVEAWEKWAADTNIRQKTLRHGVYNWERLLNKAELDRYNIVNGIKGKAMGQYILAAYDAFQEQIDNGPKSQSFKQLIPRDGWNALAQYLTAQVAPQEGAAPPAWTPALSKEEEEAFADLK